MGEGFRTKVNKSYKHFIQTKATLLTSDTLFEAVELQDIRYPCRLLEGTSGVELGLRANLIARTERTRIDLVRGTEIIGYVEGEAVTTLRKRFVADSIWPAALAVVVVTTQPQSDICEVSPSTRNSQ